MPQSEGTRKMVALISVHMGEFLGCEPKKGGKSPKVKVIDPRKTISVKQAREELARTRQMARQEAAELFAEYKARLAAEEKVSADNYADLGSIARDLLLEAERYNYAEEAYVETEVLDESEIMMRIPPMPKRRHSSRSRSPHQLGKRRQGRKQGRRPWRDLQR